MGWSTLDAYARAKGVRIGAPSPGQTLGGNHTNGSNHYLGLARDYGRESDAAAVERLFAPLATGRNPPIIELYGIGGTSLKDGKALSPEPAGHLGDHTHVAIRSGVSLADLMSGGSGGGGNSSIAGNLAGAVGSAVAFDPGGLASNAIDLAGNAADAIPGLDALGSIARAVTAFATYIARFVSYIAARGKYLLLVGAGLLLLFAGFKLLAGDLAVDTLLPAAKATK